MTDEDHAVDKKDKEAQNLQKRQPSAAPSAAQPAMQEPYLAASPPPRHEKNYSLHRQMAPKSVGPKHAGRRATEGPMGLQAVHANDVNSRSPLP